MCKQFILASAGVIAMTGSTFAPTLRRLHHLPRLYLVRRLSRRSNRLRLGKDNVSWSGTDANYP